MWTGLPPGDGISWSKGGEVRPLYDLSLQPT